MVGSLKKKGSYSLFFYLTVARYSYRFKFTTSKSKSKSEFKWTDEFDWTRHASRDGTFSDGKYGLCILINGLLIYFVAFCSFFLCSLTVVHRGRQRKSGGRQ